MKLVWDMISLDWYNVLYDNKELIMISFSSHIINWMFYICQSVWLKCIVEKTSLECKTMCWSKIHK